MRRVILMVMVAILAMGICAPVSACATDKGIVKSYCKKYYKGYTVKYVKQGSKALLKRTGKKTVFVEVIKTKSKGGKIGRTSDGYNVRYIKPVKKGKSVTVYAIYNPKNNAHDDAVAVVMQKKIRADRAL